MDKIKIKNKEKLLRKSVVLFIIPPSDRLVNYWLGVEKGGRGAGKPWFVVFADYQGVDTSSTAGFTP